MSDEIHVHIHHKDGSGTSSSPPARAPSLDTRIEAALNSTNPQLNKEAAKVVKAKLQRQARSERRAFNGEGIGFLGWILVLGSLPLFFGSVYLLTSHFLGLPGLEELVTKFRSAIPAAALFAPTPDPRALSGEPLGTIEMVKSDQGDYPDFISIAEGGEKNIMPEELPFLGPVPHVFTLGEGFGDWIATGDNAAIIAPFVCEKSRAKGTCKEVVAAAFAESYGQELLKFPAWDYALQRPVVILATDPTPTAAASGAATPTATSTPGGNCNLLPALVSKHGLLAAEIGDLSALVFTDPGEDVSYVLNCSSNAVLAGFTQGYVTLEVSLEEPMSGPKLIDKEVWYRVFNPEPTSTPQP